MLAVLRSKTMAQDRILRTMGISTRREVGEFHPNYRRRSREFLSCEEAIASKVPPAPSADRVSPEGARSAVGRLCRALVYAHRARTTHSVTIAGGAGLTHSRDVNKKGKLHSLPARSFRTSTMGDAPARPSMQTKRVASQMSQQTADVDFPLICETCLGPNPYVRMMKYPNHKECPITGRPFTVYKFRPGGAESRYKSTVVSKDAARLKNVCQVCLFDLEYGPRDVLLLDGRFAHGVTTLRALPHNKVITA